MRRPGGSLYLERWTSLLALLIVVSSGLHFFGNNVADPDLWGHLHFGQRIWREAAVPRVDVFSYTAAGAPVVEHEWLTELLLAAVYGAAGSAGLLLLKLAAAALTVLLILDATRSASAVLDREGCHPLVAAGALVLAFAVLSPGVEFRPQLFTILLLALEMALLARGDRRLLEPGARRGVSWELAAIPLVLLVWANLHGGFVVGLGLLWLFAGVIVARAMASGRAAAPPAPGERGAITGRDVSGVLLVCAAGTVAPLLNPYGTGLYVYLARTLDVHHEISEWFPVELWSAEFLRFKLIVVATAAGALFLWAQRRTLGGVGRLLDWRAPAALAGALFAFRHQRHTVLFAVIAAPLVIVAAEHTRRIALRRWPALAPRRPVLGAIGAGIAVISLVQVGGFLQMLQRDGWTIRYGRLDYPVDTVEFLRRSGLHGNIAMPFEWGEYAIWKLAPESRVFIDGRFETVYPAAVIDDYFRFMHGEPGWERLLDAYPTDIVVVQRWREIHPRLFARPDLTYVYSDPAALVFVRRGPTTAAALDRLTMVADRTDFPHPETVFP
jgi:hypothetical protein